MPINGTAPVFLSYGFRPFFLSSAIWAVLAMVLWVAMLTTVVEVPSRFDPVSWHAHEFLYGYLGAAIAGFLLTAVPNWTGRPPISGSLLGGLLVLWVLGRISVMLGQDLPAGVVAAVDLSFILGLSGLILRELIAGKNWRNLIIVGLLVLFMLGNGVFHVEAAQGRYAAAGYGLRTGLSAAVLMIAVIGGRIVPAFTRNWLKAQGITSLPKPPMQGFDKIALLLLLAALMLWIIWPYAGLTGVALLLAGCVHVARLARWFSAQCREPLLVVLHVAYAFVPLGAIAMGLDIVVPGTLGTAAAQHLWMGGAIGLMTLGVMTRATLGHTGRPLRAGHGTTSVFVALILAILARCAAGFWPDVASELHMIAALCWIVAFGGFAAIYGPMLLRPKMMQS